MKSTFTTYTYMLSKRGILYVIAIRSREILAKSDKIPRKILDRVVSGIEAGEYFFVGTVGFIDRWIEN